MRIYRFHELIETTVYVIASYAAIAMQFRQKLTIITKVIG